ncbi:MAG: hypothetical protein NTY11_02630 [Candidatus Parcubacteria bacterium]|nr:hypothetical protein [Candidatus Parcubacteria bacterium]
MAAWAVIGEWVALGVVALSAAGLLALVGFCMRNLLVQFLVARQPQKKSVVKGDEFDREISTEPITLAEALQSGRFVWLKGRVCKVFGARSGRLVLQWKARDGRLIKGRHTRESLERLWGLARLAPCN